MTDFGGALLVANAPLRWHPRLAAMAASADPLLAADGGANHLARLGLKPTAVVGDLDSVSPETRAWLGEECMVDRSDQDRTDLDKALEYAFDEAMGERLIFEAADQTVLAVDYEISLAAIAGESWSFWTFDPTVRVTVEGVRWPIENATIDAGNRPSISNEAIDDHIRVRATGGSVVVMRRFASFARR